MSKGKKCQRQKPGTITKAQNYMLSAHWAHDVILEIFDLDNIFKACAAPLKSDFMSTGYKMPSQFLLPFHNIKGK